MVFSSTALLFVFASGRRAGAEIFQKRLSEFVDYSIFFSL
jgi:hypothetical protein